MYKSFKEIFTSISEAEIVSEDLIEAKEEPEVILRKNGIKIKNIIPTNFGDEIILAKKYDISTIKHLLSNFKIKVKNNSIFIEKML